MIFENEFFKYFETIYNKLRLQPLYLGGVMASGGGTGGPPGGFLGKLPQTSITYDLSELALNSTPISGMSLLDNLNHIRYLITTISGGGSGVGSSTFLGLTDAPHTYVGQADKVIFVKTDQTGLEFRTSPAGTTTFLGLTDTPSTYAGQANKAVYVNAGQTALEFRVPASGGASNLSTLSDVNLISPTNGQSLVYNGSQWTNVTISGGGEGLSQTVWNPRAKPTTAHAKDDEFPTGTLNGKWTLFDPGSAIDSYSVVPGQGLIVVPSLSNLNMVAGFYQSIPTIPFTMWTYVGGCNDFDGNNNYAGLMVGEKLATYPTTSDIYTIGTWKTTSEGYNISRWDDYANRSVDIASDYHIYHWVRVRITSDNYLHYDFSTDGLMWQSKGAEALSFTPLQIGLFVWSSVGGPSEGLQITFPFFRCIAGAGINQVMSGNNTKLYLA